jgi:electron transfer flavoprotein beta subunit
MDVLVCVKRVPGTGSSITLTEDGRAVDTRHLGFTIGPHEECAVEEAVRIVADHGGTATVLTVGPPEADEQLRYALSMGADRAVRVDCGVADPDPQQAAAAIARALPLIIGTSGEHGTESADDDGSGFDLILFGNESADAGHYQVGIRVAHELGLPIVSGVKGIEVADGRVRLHRPVPDGLEVYEAPLPAAAAVKEGLNLPRYPSMRGRLRAARAQIQSIAVDVPVGGLRTRRLRLPEQGTTETVVLGHGPDAAPAVADLIEELL